VASNLSLAVIREADTILCKELLLQFLLIIRHGFPSSLYNTISSSPPPSPSSSVSSNFSLEVIVSHLLGEL